MKPETFESLQYLPEYRDMEILEKLEKENENGGGDERCGENNVILNQFDVPSYDPWVVREQYFPQTKRIVQPPFKKYQFKISEMW